MFIDCPFCQFQEDMPESGKTICSKCRTIFHVFIFAPPPQKTAVIPQAAVSAEDLKDAKCYLHAENKADHICERCGSFICSVCLTQIEKKNLCPKCFEKLDSEGTLLTTQTSFFNWGRMILGLSLFSFLCYGFITAPFIFVGGFYALFQIKNDPLHRGKASVIAGMILAGISFLVWCSLFFIPMIMAMSH